MQSLEEQLDAALRSVRLQAAPFSKGLPRVNPKKPGRKPGDDYGTHLRRAMVRQFSIAVGRCACCAGRVQGRHALQTSDALGACASQIGPKAQVAAVMLNKELGLSQGKISRFFQSFFGIRLSRGGSCRIILRAAVRCEENYQVIVRHVEQSPVIVPDDTGWRIGGKLAWLHAAVGDKAVAYRIDRHRQRLRRQAHAAYASIG